MAAIYTRAVRHAEADAAGRGVPVAAFRHSAWDPTPEEPPPLFAHVFHLQAEPFTAGAFTWGSWDTDAGPSRLHLAVVPFHTNREDLIASADPYATALSAHMCAPWLERRDATGSRVDPDERKPPAAGVPRIIIANSQMAEVLRAHGRRFAYLSAPDDADAAMRERASRIRAGGLWMRELALQHQVAGQGIVIDVLSRLREHFTVSLCDTETGHLPAVLGAITGGPDAAWRRAGEEVGPLLSPDEQDALLELHYEVLRARTGGDTAAMSAALAVLEHRYRPHAQKAIDAVAEGLQILRAIPEEPEFRDARRLEDAGDYASRAHFLLGRHGGRRRAVQDVRRNAVHISELEKRRAVHDLRMRATDPLVRCDWWTDRKVIEGPRTAVVQRQEPTGRLTPTGRAQTQGVVELVIACEPTVDPPGPGTSVLWGGDPKMQTQGEVIAVGEPDEPDEHGVREVTVLVRPPGIRAVRDAAARWRNHDVWLRGRRPFAGQTQTPDVLPATHLGDPSGPAPLDDDADAAVVGAEPMPETPRSYS